MALLENQKVKTLPQANDFNKIVKIVGAVFNLRNKRKVATQVTLGKELEWHPRDISYYVHAATKAGLIDFVTGENGKHYYNLTQATLNALSTQNDKAVISFFIERIMANDVCRCVVHNFLDYGRYPSKKEILKMIKQHDIKLAESTIERRISAIVSWSKWAISHIKRAY